MSDLKFFCPECGQKIAYDAGYSGREVTCPTCQKSVALPPNLVPAPVRKTNVDPPPKSASPARDKQPSAPTSTAAPAEKSNATGLKFLHVLTLSHPYLAFAGFIVLVWGRLGSIPIIILIWAMLAFVPMALAQISGADARRWATVSLSITAAGLGLLLFYVGAATFARWYHAPKIVIRESRQELDSLKPRIVDEVLIGSPSESEHGLRGKNLLAGPFDGKHWRAAIASGWVSYDMKVIPDHAMDLNCRYWGGEQAGRTFDILIDDKIIATQDLNFNVPGHFFDAEYKIPRSLTHGKMQVTVKFQAHPGVAAGGLFGCQTLKR